MLTEQERQVMLLSCELWNKFLELPIQRDFDRAEMERDIHSIQQRLMARPTRRYLDEVLGNGN